MIEVLFMFSVLKVCLFYVKNGDTVIDMYNVFGTNIALDVSLGRKDNGIWKFEKDITHTEVYMSDQRRFDAETEEQKDITVMTSKLLRKGSCSIYSLSRFAKR